MKEVARPDSLVSRVDELHEVGVLGQEVEGVELVLEEVVAVEAHSEDAGGDESDDDLEMIIGKSNFNCERNWNLFNDLNHL